MMYLLRYLTLALLVVSAYNGLFPQMMEKETTNYSKNKKKSYNEKLQLAALVALLFVILCILICKSTFAIALLSVPGSFICVLGIVAAVETVREITISKGNNELSTKENNALTLTGLFLGMISMFCINGTEIKERVYYLDGPIGDLGKCIILIAAYSSMIFLVVALSIKPLRDMGKCVQYFSNKLAQRYFLFVEKVKMWIPPRNRKKILSEKYWIMAQKEKGWKCITIYLLFSLMVVFDVGMYLFQYIVGFLLLMPFFCVCFFVLLLGRRIMRMVNSLMSVSNRRATIISFRLSIIAGFLIVVIANRIDPIVSHEEITTILEFISSVVIVPVFLEWLIEALHREKSINNKNN